MDIKDLDIQARNGAEMPPALAGYEQAYYQASRYLYRQYKDKIMTLEQCREEKKHMVEAYNVGKAQWDFFIGLTVLEEKLSRLADCGFNSALEWEILEETSKLLNGVEGKI